MTSFCTFMRQALLAACIILPQPTLANPYAQFDAATGTVRLSGLNVSERAEALLRDSALRLQVATLDTVRGMPVTMTEQGPNIVIMPRFALKIGINYVVTLDLTDASYDVGISLPEAEVTIPEVTGFAPSQAMIPANTLRLYVQFSEPMARGQVRDAVTLIHSDGRPVSSPFLNLEAELWDPSQTRVTLLLDPGRIKQGVGPNTQAGAPLQPGESYALVLSERMQSAAGATLGTDVTLAFHVGLAERRAVNPAKWHILAPAAGSYAPITVAFDRVMDSGATQRLLHMQDSVGSRLRGAITSDGGGWSFTPVQAWQADDYQLIVDPELEDVSGNTIAAPFDAASGTIGAEQAPIVLTININ